MLRLSHAEAFAMKTPTSSAVTFWVYSILGCNLILQVVLLVLIARYNPDGVWAPDSQDYHVLAINLLDRGEFSRFSKVPFDAEVFRTPGYPLFLAVIYKFVGIHPLRVIPFQIGLSLLTLYLTYRIAERLFNEKVGLWAAGLLAVDPVSMLHSHLVLSETPFACCLTTSVYFFLGAVKEDRRYGRSVLGSFFLALATLTRPTTYYLGTILLPLILLAYWLSTADRKKAVRSVLAVVVVQVILVGGWQVRNYLRTGSAEFSHIKGAALLFERASGIVAMAEGLSYDEAKKKLVSLYAGPLHHGLARETQAELGARWEKEGYRIIQQHPFMFLWVALKGGAALMVGPSNLAMLFGVKSEAFRSALLQRKFDRFPTGVWLGGVSAAAYGLLYLVVLYAGIVLFVRRGRLTNEALFLILVALYVIAISSGPEAYSRFRMPIMPFFCILSAAGYFRTNEADSS